MVKSGVESNKEESIENAISAYKEALKVFTEENYPEDYSYVQGKLSNAYLELSDLKDREENLEKAREAEFEASKY